MATVAAEDIAQVWDAFKADPYFAQEAEAGRLHGEAERFGGDRVDADLEEVAGLGAFDVDRAG